MNIDTVAKAIFQADGFPGHHVLAHTWEGLDDLAREGYRDLAQAAINALQLKQEWGVKVTPKQQKPFQVQANEIAAALEHNPDFIPVSRHASPWIRTEPQ